MGRKICDRCLMCKDISEFPFKKDNKKVHRSICQVCAAELQTERKKASHHKSVTCFYGYENHCTSSRESNLCCFECPEREYCDWACLNRPDKCGCK